jgi:hypothetical protein
MGARDWGVLYKLTRASEGWTESVPYTFNGFSDSGCPCSISNEKELETMPDQPEADATGATGNQGDRAAARAALGLPDSIDQLTDDQRKKYIGQPVVEVEAENADQVEVVAMQDSDDGSREEVA